jgi:hypothetical protein
VVLRCGGCHKALAEAYWNRSSSVVHFPATLSPFEPGNWDELPGGHYRYRCSRARCTAAPVTISSLAVALAVQQAVKDGRKSILVQL